MQKGRQQQQQQQQQRVGADLFITLLAKLQLEISRRRFVAHKAVNNTSECITNNRKAAGGKKKRSNTLIIKLVKGK